MSSASNIIDLVLLLAGAIAFTLIVSAPYILSNWASASRDKFERDIVQQAEIARKVAIAEAAAAARARGETFVPPADYDR